MVVFVGRTVTDNDLFAKLVDTGAVIVNVDGTIALLRRYLDGLWSLKIGNIAGVCSRN